jgi:uncharacterized protein YdhG (YjbR/CyaY superfamily)
MGFPLAVQDVLRSVRAAVCSAAPEAEERLSYRMPAMFQGGVLVYYGAFKHHLGLFPPVEDPVLRERAARYAGPKGNLQFPYAAPIPYDLIVAIVAARLKANQVKSGRVRGMTAPKHARRANNAA